MIILLTPTAAEQLEELNRYYASVGGLRLEERLQEALSRGFQRIAEFPRLAPRISQRTRLYIIRKFHLGIFYQIKRRYLRVIAVRDLRRDWL